MSVLEDKIDVSSDDEHEVEDTITDEEQQKIETIQKATFIPPVQEKPKPFNIWSLFNFYSTEKPLINTLDLVGAVGGTQSDKPFDLQNFLYLDKSVIINNISGKDAYVILTPCPITIVSSFSVSLGFSAINASVDASLDTKGEYKSQKVSILNDTSSRCSLDNTKFYCTLYINDGEHWKKSWDNRRFNGKKFNINILEKHSKAALIETNIPNF